MPKNTLPNMPKAEFAALLAAIRGPMERTANVIASDLEAACAEAGERLDNAGLVESCLDGGNLMAMYGGDGGAADRAVGEACKKYDYRNLFNRITKAVRLI
jgi:hypothetical protein